jgi:hypothetical protein
MRRHGPLLKRSRGALYEWSVAAGQVSDHGLDAWLAARSVADDHSNPLDSKQCKLSLAGLGAAFRELAADTAQQEFIKAHAACGRLGLRLADLDPKARGYFEKYSSASPLGPDQPESLENDIETVRKSVVIAYYETEPENDRGMDALIGEPDAYRYRMLADILSDSRRARRDVPR